MVQTPFKPKSLLLIEQFCFQTTASLRVRRDELYFLDRCGFDRLQLPVGVDPTDTLKAFDKIIVHY